MMTDADFAYLDALDARLDAHRGGLAMAEAWKPGRRRDRQIAWSRQNIANIEAERDAATARMGLKPVTLDEAMRDDELLALLLGEPA